MALEFYNSLTKKTGVFIPSSPDFVGMYTCGPTVYDYVTIGNWRTYTLSDLVHRVLSYNGYHVRSYMNITDVGHLTGDNDGDADTGEDRMEKAKKREGKNAWDIAKFYTEDFKKGYEKLNFLPQESFLKATEHIDEQIALVEKLFENGIAYKINDGIYFNTEKYEKCGFKYGELSNLDQIKIGARVEFNSEKINPRDFALWKFSSEVSLDKQKRDMEWQSPWGVGFPGWHIECSAMSMKYLGDQFDIHLGGEDLKSTHHPNEIAQSQGTTGKSPFVYHWIHGAFLQVNGGRMGKSIGNAYNLADIEKRGISPLALRYFYFGGHYRSPLNFTWEALEASQTALTRIKNMVWSNYVEDESIRNTEHADEYYKTRFLDAINDDLNMPAALAILHELLHDKNIFPVTKFKTALDFDRVLGLNLGENTKIEIPDDVMSIVKEREQARQDKNWKKSDELRDKILDAGYTIKDTDNGSIVAILNP